MVTRIHARFFVRSCKRKEFCYREKEKNHDNLLKVPCGEFLRML